MRVSVVLLGFVGLSSAFLVPTTPAPRVGALKAANAAGDDDWRAIVGSEANLRQYLGKEGFRYNLNKTPQEVAKEGDYNLLEKMFGATSNNKAKLEAKASTRSINIETYSPEKAKENKVWMAKYGHKRWGLGYVDKSALDEEKKTK